MIPPYVRPFLWSYDVQKLDVLRNKKRIITNVLNLGSHDATEWLFSTYNTADIKSAISDPLPGEWSKKSLNYWGLMFDIAPDATKVRSIH